MDLNFTPEEEALRTEVRTFLAEEYPSRLADKARKLGIPVWKFGGA